MLLGHNLHARRLSRRLSAFELCDLAVVCLFDFVVGRGLPASTGAPQVGQKAPDFTLTDAPESQSRLRNFFEPVTVARRKECCSSFIVALVTVVQLRVAGYRKKFGPVSK